MVIKTYKYYHDFHIYIFRFPKFRTILSTINLIFSSPSAWTQDERKRYFFICDILAAMLWGPMLRKLTGASSTTMLCSC